jgi:hypothetical protein
LATLFLQSFNDTAVIPREEAPLAADPIMAKKWNQFKTKWFSLNIGAALLLDYNTLSQDANNLEQVGKIEPATEFRGQRLVLSGNIFFAKHPGGI